MGKSAEAETISVLAMIVRKKILSQEHPDTLASINNLAGLLQSQGKYSAAEPLYRETLS
jgi:Tetratricopeptide repeat